ncbi:MAG: hypothetical protein ACK4TI_00025 [Nitrososphaerales archaeon]
MTRRLVEYPLAFRFISIGAEDVKARFETLLETYRRGSVSSDEFDRSVRRLHTSLYTKVRAVNMLSTAYRAAHPNLMLFTNALSTLQSVAYRGLTLFNSYLLYQLRLGDAARDAAKAKEEAERAERRYLDAVRLNGEAAPEALKAKSDWIEAAEKAREAAEKESQAHQELNIWLGLTALTAAGMASQLIANFGKILASVAAVKAAVAGLSASLTASTIAVGALTAGVAALAGGLAYSAVNIAAHKTETNTWREAAEAALESLRNYPPVLKELLTALTMAAGGWTLIGEKIAAFTSDSAEEIVEWASSVREAATSGLNTFYTTSTSTLTSIIDALAEWFSSSLHLLGKWGLDAYAAVASFTSNSASEIAGYVSESLSAFTDFASRGLAEILRFTSASASNLSSWITEWLVKVATWASENANRFFEAASSFIKSLGEGLTGAAAKLVDALNQIGSVITGFLSNLAAAAWGWGYRIASSIADGIRAAISSIISAAQAAAAAIASFLGIKSPAEQGPLSKLNEWGPNLVKTYAEGVRSSLSVLREAALEAASTLSVRTLGVINVSVKVEGSSEIASEVSRRIALEIRRVMA